MNVGYNGIRITTTTSREIAVVRNTEQTFYIPDYQPGELQQAWKRLTVTDDGNIILTLPCNKVIWSAFHNLGADMRARFRPNKPQNACNWLNP